MGVQKSKIFISEIALNTNLKYVMLVQYGKLYRHTWRKALFEFNEFLHHIGKETQSFSNNQLM